MEKMIMIDNIRELAINYYTIVINIIAIVI